MRQGRRCRDELAGPGGAWSPYAVRPGSCGAGPPLPGRACGRLVLGASGPARVASQDKAADRAARSTERSSRCGPAGAGLRGRAEEPG